MHPGEILQSIYESEINTRTRKRTVTEITSYIQIIYIIYVHLN